MQLNVIAEDSSSVTLGWTPPAGASYYLFYFPSGKFTNAPAIDKDGNVKKNVKVGKANLPVDVVCVCRPASHSTVLDVGTYPGTTPPPPPPVDPIRGSIVDGSIISGKLTWSASKGPCVFSIDGGGTWREDSPPYVYGGDGVLLDTATLANGSHAFRVAMVDGSSEHIVHATVQNAVTPPPPPPPPPPSTGKVDGVGVVRYAGTLSSTGHLNDGTYDIVVASWDDAAQLAKSSALTFAYQNLGPPGYQPANLSDPDGFVAKCVALKKQYPGLDGIFLDNCNSWDRATQLPFLAGTSSKPGVGKRLKDAGLLVMLNAMASGANQNDGSADRAWYQDIGLHATHIMLEYWQQARGGPEVFNLRNRGSASYADYWDEWQKNIDAVHLVGCKAVALSFGVLSNAIYCRASWLLVAQEGDVYCHTFANVPEGPDPYNPAWMKNMGAPLDPPDPTKTTRRFQNGTVSVDPVKGTAVIG